MALELLSKQNLNVDKTLSIQFKARKDQRDIRPLTYKGRIAFGGIVSENAWLFRSSIRSDPTSGAASRIRDGCGGGH